MQWRTNVLLLKCSEEAGAVAGDRGHWSLEALWTAGLKY